MCHSTLKPCTVSPLPNTFKAMVTLIVEYFKDGVVWKPRYDITSAVAFFKKIVELRTQHIWFRIYLADE